MQGKSNFLFSFFLECFCFLGNASRKAEAIFQLVIKDIRFYMSLLFIGYEADTPHTH